MKIRNVSPLGDLFLPAIGRDVASDEVFEVTPEIGASLLEQPANWAPVKETK